MQVCMKRKKNELENIETNDEHTLINSTHLIIHAAAISISHLELLMNLLEIKAKIKIWRKKWKLHK